MYMDKQISNKEICNLHEEEGYSEAMAVFAAQKLIGAINSEQVEKLQGIFDDENSVVSLGYEQLSKSKPAELSQEIAMELVDRMIPDAVDPDLKVIERVKETYGDDAAELVEKAKIFSDAKFNRLMRSPNSWGYEDISGSIDKKDIDIARDHGDAGYLKAQAVIWARVLVGEVKFDHLDGLDNIFEGEEGLQEGEIAKLGEYFKARIVLEAQELTGIITSKQKEMIESGSYNKNLLSQPNNTKLDDDFEKRIVSEAKALAENVVSDRIEEVNGIFDGENGTPEFDFGEAIDFTDMDVSHIVEQISINLVEQMTSDRHVELEGVWDRVQEVLGDKSKSFISKIQECQAVKDMIFDQVKPGWRYVRNEPAPY